MVYFFLFSFYGRWSSGGSKAELVPSEERWTAEKRLHITCREDPLAPGDPQKQSWISVATLCNDIKDTQETFTLQVCISTEILNSKVSLKLGVNEILFVGHNLFLLNLNMYEDRNLKK